MKSNGIYFGSLNSDTSHFVPNEIVLHIFGFLPKSALLVASRVSQSFYALANDYSLWERHCSKDIHKKGKSVDFVSDIEGIQVKGKVFIGFRQTSFKLYVLACRFYILSNCTQHHSLFPIHETLSTYPNKETIVKTKEGTTPIEKKTVCDSFISGQSKLFAEKDITEHDLLDFRLERINRILNHFSLICEKKGESICLSISSTKVEHLQSTLLDWALENSYREEDITLLIESGEKVTGWSITRAISREYSVQYIGFLLEMKIENPGDRYDFICYALTHPQNKELIQLLLANGSTVYEHTLSNTINGKKFSDEIVELLLVNAKLDSIDINFLLKTALVFCHSEKIIQLLIKVGARVEEEHLDTAVEFKNANEVIQLLQPHKALSSSDSDIELLQWEQIKRISEMGIQILSVVVSLY